VEIGLTRSKNSVLENAALAAAGIELLGPYEAALVRVVEQLRG
jgi:hypothetical protein